MEEEDGYFVSMLFEGGQGRRGLGPPTFEDWENFRVFLKFLKLFYDVTIRLSGSLYVTFNMYFQEICGIQAHLHAFSESGDYVLIAMAEKIKMKYNKRINFIDFYFRLGFNCLFEFAIFRSSLLSSIFTIIIFFLYCFISILGRILLHFVALGFYYNFG